MIAQEKLIIKNFGPIVNAEIDIKPFMVFIGESGSGKSVILKLLSLFRWIYKKIALREVAKKVGFKKEFIRFRIDRMLRESRLDDFCVKGSEAEYWMDDFCVSIYRNGKVKLKIQTKPRLSEVSLEKISFITENRFSIPMLVNNQIRGVIPYHLEKTFEDFNNSFEHLQGVQNNKKIQLKIFNIELLKEKYDIQDRFYISDNKAKTKLHNASSGMKSVSIIELISTYFVNDKEYMQDKYKDFIVSIFSQLEQIENENLNVFFDKLKDVKLGKQRYSLFIEEPELSLFPNAQNKLVEYLVNLCFNLNTSKTIQVAFSTHSPYMLSSLNCLLLANEIAAKKPNLQDKIQAIIPNKYWLDINKFDAFKVENGKVSSIIDRETNLILADKIDSVSEDIAESFDKLLELESK